MKYKHIAILIGVLATLSSCIKEIEFNGEKQSPRLVLYGTFVPDSTVSVHFTASRFFLAPDNVFQSIENVTVELWKDGGKIETLQYIDEIYTEYGSQEIPVGYYRGNHIVREGETLTIKATCSGYDPVECTTTILPPAPVLSVDTLHFSIVKELYSEGIYNDGEWESSGEATGAWFTFEGDLSISFRDVEAVPDYYNLNIFLRSCYEKGYLDNEVWYESDDIVFNATDGSSLFDNGGRPGMFGDELFNGKEYKLKCRVNSYARIDYEGIRWNGWEADSIGKYQYSEIVVELQHVTFDLYRFEKTRAASEDLSDMAGLFAEPVQVYSNVKGGMGVLGSYTPSVYRIKVD